MNTQESKYYVYILECEDGSLYTGISTDPERRFKEHKSGMLGAKYTKAHKPIKSAQRLEITSSGRFSYFNT